MSLSDRIRRSFLRCRRRSTPEPNPERPDIVTASECTDYFALAGLLIDQFGSDARQHAAGLMDEAVQEDDALAGADWLAVGQAIALLSTDSAATRH